METKMLQKQTRDRPKMYVRYMDNIFVVFDNDNACMSFLEVLIINLQTFHTRLRNSKIPCNFGCGCTN